MKFKKLVKADENILDGFKAEVSHQIQISIFKSEMRDETKRGKVYGYVVEYGDTKDSFATEDRDTVGQVLQDIREYYRENGQTIRFND